MWKKSYMKKKTLALILSLCILVSVFSNFKVIQAQSTNGVIERIADNSTMDSYINALLSETSGSRYAGRVWTDKSVFTCDDILSLDSQTDGYTGKISFNSDFGTVFSALTSSQIIHEYPPVPIDLVIALDMSASMAQDTRFPVEDSQYYSYPASQRTMEDRIKNSRIQQTLDAVNDTIDALMSQNKENRVSVIVYGAGAAVLMPLAHYTRVDNKPYLSVNGMETLYDLNDLTIDSTYGWVWTTNRDACYTIRADANYSDYDNPTFEKHFTYLISNNVDNRHPRNPTDDFILYTEVVKANPGYLSQESANRMSFDNNQHELNADEYIGYLTNMQGGIYLAYAQLALTDKTTFTATLFTGEEVTVPRIPAAIIMSDGGTNFAFNEMNDWDKFYGVYSSTYYDGFRNDNSTVDHTQPEAGWTMDFTDLDHRLGMNIGDEWYNVYLPGQFGDTHVVSSLYNPGVLLGNGVMNGIPAFNNAGVFYSNNGSLMATGGTILQLMMTASYMKSVVTTHYELGWNENHATKESRTDMMTFTVGVDSTNVPQWGRLRLYPVMDPKNYLFSNERWSDNVFSGELDVDLYKGGFNRALNSWSQFASTGETSIIIDGVDAVSNIAGLPDNYVDKRFNVPITNQDVVDNIIYTDGFFDIDSSELANKFKEILSEIYGKAFVPLSGDNATGMIDSITYQDPLGEYIELKNGAVTVDGDVAGSNENNFDMSLLVFGEMHGLVRAGVYDYKWNYDYMHNNTTKPGYPNKNIDPDTTPMEIGWYKGDAENAIYSYNNGLPEGCSTAEEAWSKGWVLRLNYITLAEFVPISGITETMKPTDVPEQIKNVVYTCYRFADAQQDRNKLRYNPIYGNEVPKELIDKWNAYYAQYGSYPVGNNYYSDYPGVYRLSDIRVWMEHTGDFIDSMGALTPEEESGYDDSIYVNIPIAAVPTQCAEITLGADGPINYKDNLDLKNQSTPLRLFYGVGLDENLIIRDSNGNQTGVDVSKISGEYIATHSDSKNIYFLSNWYSNTVYRGYDSGYEYSTRGDAVVSFSPDVKNRYYIFQKSLPLIAHAYRVLNISGDVASVDNADGGSNNATTWEHNETPSSWSGGEFIGTYKDNSSFRRALNSIQNISGIDYIKDDKNYYYPVPKNINDAVITYTKDQLLNVDGDDRFSSDDYFFLCVEYYVPIDGVGHDIQGNPVADTRAVRKVNHMIARKGSAFGSGLASENINNGDMLCWMDIKNNCTLELKYNSKTDTGDKTRGRPTVEKLTLTGTALKSYLAGLGISNVDAEVNYWTSIQNDPRMQVLIEEIDAVDTKQEKFDALFDWSVAAKTGGIRVGDMFNNLQSKGGTYDGEFYTDNLTQTANNYYVPTLSETSTSGEGLVINNYLGNNGKMSIANANLIITKTLNIPEGFNMSHSLENEEFEFQIYEKEMVGERLAQRLIYNPFSKSWQKRVESLDILTDNSSLLIDLSGKRALFNSEGKQVIEVIENNVSNYYYINENGEISSKYTGELYYIYLPSKELIYHLFDADYYTTEFINGAGTTTYYSDEAMSYNENQLFKPADSKHTAGTREYWTSKAELIPCSQVHNVETGDVRWDHDTNHSEWNDHIKLDYYTLVTVIPDPDGIESTVYSPFSSRTQYMTVPLYFGYDFSLAIHLEACTDGSFIACTHKDAYKLDDLFASTDIAHTACFKLKANEGILLTGLGYNVDYTVTEKLTDGQLKQAYRFENIQHVSKDGTNILDTSSMSSKTDYFTEQVHYANTIDPELFVVTKKLVDISGNIVTHPPNVEFDFKTKIYSDNSLYMWRGTDLTKAPTLSNYTDYLDTLTHIKSTDVIKLKPNEAAVFYGLISDIDYLVEEVQNDDYPIYSGIYTAGGHVSHVKQSPNITSNRIDFANLMSTGTLTIEKQVNGELEDKSFDFNINLSNLSTLDTVIVIKYTNTGSKNMTFNTDMTISLKHGERVVISGLPINTHYSIEENIISNYKLEDILLNSTSIGLSSVNGDITQETPQVNYLFINRHESPITLPATGGTGFNYSYIIICSIGIIMVLAVVKTKNLRRN